LVSSLVVVRFRLRRMPTMRRSVTLRSVSAWPPGRRVGQPVP